MSGDFTARALRSRNRSSVLRAVMRGGPTTRPTLGRDLALSAGTITNVVSDLVGEGLLLEAGQRPSDGGRPSTVVSLDPQGAYFIGADVGENGVAVELFDLTLAPVARVDEATAARNASPEEIGAVLAAGVQHVVALCPRPERIFGVGLGVPGIVERGRGFTHGAATDVAIDAQSLGWPIVPLASWCAEVPLPVHVDNGAKTLAAGESWFGAAAESADSISVLHGRGIGAGIVTGGVFLHGAAGGAGELGHMKVSVGGPRCGCGQRGCLEAHVGGGAIAKRWTDASSCDEATAEATWAHLFAAEAVGDSAASALVAEIVEVLGLGLGSAVNLFNPRRVVLGGWAGLQIAERHLDALAAATRAASLNRPAAAFELAAAQLGSDGVTLGAALLAVERLIAAPFEFGDLARGAS